MTDAKQNGTHNISDLEANLNYAFKNKAMLKEALTHRSYSAEKSLDYDNQRLEFLGDAVLEIALTEYLFNLYPDAPEGQLTKMRSALVQQPALAEIASELELEHYMLLGKGEVLSGGQSRNSTLADAVEAILGGIFLDSESNLEVVKSMLLPLIKKIFPEPAEMLNNLNPKGALQEYTQRHNNSTPKYKTLEVSGPDHAPMYKVVVCVKNKTIAEGIAANRKAAETEAAKNALKELTV